MTYQDLAHRVADKFLVGDGCWEWIAAKDQAGYGKLTFGPTSQQAHRAIYEMMVGPISDGLTLDHLCRNRGCVRPDHLEPCTLGENVRRSPRVTRNHCAKGHPYDGNLYINPGSGQRVCVTCRKAYTAKYRAKKRARRDSHPAND